MGTSQHLSSRKFFEMAWPELGGEVFDQNPTVFIKLHQAFERHPDFAVPLLDLLLPVCRNAVDSGVDASDISAILTGAGELFHLGRVAERSSIGTESQVSHG